MASSKQLALISEILRAQPSSGSTSCLFLLNFRAEIYNLVIFFSVIENVPCMRFTKVLFIIIIYFIYSSYLQLTINLRLELYPDLYPESKQDRNFPFLVQQSQSRIM